MPRLARITLALLLAATLASTAVLAAPPGGGQPRQSAAAALDAPDLLGYLWRFLARLWIKNGSEVDPSGLQTKNGSVIEPNGSSLQVPIPMTANQGNGH